MALHRPSGSPSFVKEKRFHNWLEGARDWAISRNRFWGTPLPIWHSADWEEVICVGSIEELYQLSGVRVRPPRTPSKAGVPRLGCTPRILL